jgi:hypothetical protein
MSSQTLTFPCPFCGRKMGVGAELLGKHVRCPHCKQVVVAPSATASQTPSTSAPKDSPPSPPKPVPAPAAAPPKPPLVKAPLPAPPKPTSVSPSPSMLQTPNEQAPGPSTWDDKSLPMFNFSQKKEAADSILSDPNESEDDVFGSHGSNKLAIPKLSELPSDPPPPVQQPPVRQPPTPVHHQPVAVSAVIPPQAVPAPAAQVSANPFDFETDLPSGPSPAAPQPRSVAPLPAPVVVLPKAAPVPAPIATESAPLPVVVLPAPIEEQTPKQPTTTPTRSSRNSSGAVSSNGIPKAIFYAVAGYAVLMTLLAIYGLFMK